MVNFSQLVVASERQVELRRKANVVGAYLSKFLHLCGSLDGIDLGYDDLFSLESGRRFGLFCVDDEDCGVVGSVNLIKGLLVIDELEGLRPVEFVPVTHLAQFK